MGIKITASEERVFRLRRLPEDDTIFFAYVEYHFRMLFLAGSCCHRSRFYFAVWVKGHCFRQNHPEEKESERLMEK